MGCGRRSSSVQWAERFSRWGRGDNLRQRSFSSGSGVQFRIVGAHQHRAVVGPSTFVCLRRDTVTDEKLVVFWIAARNETVLKDDCRTLNEAKNLCRRALAEELAART